MSSQSTDLILAAYEAYDRGDLDTMLGLVDPDLEWTYLDPGVEDPQPQVCHGRDQLEEALRHRAEHGLRSELEEIIGNGDRVMVVVRTPGADAHRLRKADDRDFAVFTVRGGRVVALRDCRDREQAAFIAGMG